MLKTGDQRKTTVDCASQKNVQLSWELTNGDIIPYYGGHNIALRVVPGNMYRDPVLDVAVTSDLYAVHIPCTEYHAMEWLRMPCT